MRTMKPPIPSSSPKMLFAALAAVCATACSETESPSSWNAAAGDGGVAGGFSDARLDGDSHSSPSDAIAQEDSALDGHAGAAGSNDASQDPAVDPTQDPASEPDTATPGPECATMVSTPIDVPVIVLTYNPVIPSHGGKKLIEVMGWHDPDALTDTLVNDARSASCGFVRYSVVERNEVNAFPKKLDGFQYDESSYLSCMTGDHSTCHMPDDVDYAAIFADNGIASKIAQYGSPEVWIWGAPYFGTDEYAMKIPGDAPYNNPNCQKPEAYWFYRPKNIPDLGKTVWVMGFSYERAEGEMVESYGHRIEGILSVAVAGCVWTSTGTDPWSKYTWIDKNMPGQAQCGGVHYAPNSTTDYDWSNQNAVPSACNDWYQYPSLAGSFQPLNCQAWGCDGYRYKVWWMSHLPHAAGSQQAVLNNWWMYIADYDHAVP